MNLKHGDRIQIGRPGSWKSKYTLRRSLWQEEGQLVKFEALEEGEEGGCFTVLSDGQVPNVVELRVKPICRIYGVLDDEKTTGDKVGQRIAVACICRGCGFFISNCRCY